jgi:pimeloyl-ACP methyl ester carboxylesterase
VLLGHSMGGLVAQLAAARRPVAGLILLAPSPAWGQPVTSLFDLGAGFALAALRGPYWLQAVEPDYPVVRGVTLDRLDEDAARRIYARMVPESGRALFEILNWWLDPTLAALAPAVKAPALVVAGGADQVHSPATVAPTAARLGVAPLVAPELSHWTMGEPGSDRVAAACLEWLARL